MGTQAYPEMLLVEMARSERSGAKATAAWVERRSPGCGDESSRRLESGRPTRAASSDQQLGPTTIRLSGSIGPCKPVRLPVQPPDAETGTSGGVGGCRGAIPGTRPDLKSPTPLFPFEQECGRQARERGESG